MKTKFRFLIAISLAAFSLTLGACKSRAYNSESDPEAFRVVKDGTPEMLFKVTNVRDIFPNLKDSLPKGMCFGSGLASGKTVYVLWKSDSCKDLVGQLTRAAPQYLVFRDEVYTDTNHDRIVFWDSPRLVAGSINKENLVMLCDESQYKCHIDFDPKNNSFTYQSTN